MTGPGTLVATALISAILISSALAQEPAAFAAQNPDRDVLNGGALTPAGRLAREQPGDAAAALYGHRYAFRRGPTPSTPPIVMTTARLI